MATALEKIRLLGTALSIGVSFLVADVRAETVRYDPETCSTDAGDQVFVRLQSGLAFAFPADDLWYLGGAPVEDAKPIANPSEPEGCPLNPIVTAAMAVVYRAVAPPAPDEPSDERWRPEILQIFGHAGPTSVQDSDLRLFASFCSPETANRVVAATANLEECRAIVGVGPQKDWASFIAVHAGSHPEFQGRTFVARCENAVSPRSGRSCAAHYQIEDGLSVMYRFFDSRVPPAHMAEFDLQIRAFVEARSSPEYDEKTRR